MSIIEQIYPLFFDLFSNRIDDYFGSAAIVILGFASCSTGRLNVGLTSNSLRDAGNARYALKGEPFLFTLLCWTHCRRENSNPAPVRVPVLPYRALTPRFAGRFSSASPLDCVLDSHSAIRLRLCGFRCTLTPKTGGQGPLGRVSTGASPHSSRLPWGESPAFSSPGGELHGLTVSLSVRLGRTLCLSFSALGRATKPHRLYALWGVRQPWQPGRLPYAKFRILGNAPN